MAVLDPVLQGKKVQFQTWSYYLRMINPWLSDYSGEHLDQPTETYSIFHSLLLYFSPCSNTHVQGLNGRTSWKGDGSFQGMFSTTLFEDSMMFPLYRPRQNITVDWFS